MSLYTVAQAMGKGSPFADSVDGHTREQAEILVELAFPTDFEALAFQQTQARMKAEESSGVPLDLDDLLIPHPPAESYAEDGEWES